MDDALRMTAAEQGRAIGAGRLDPRDLAEGYLEAAERHPDRDRIYARLTPERARAEAAAAAARARRGDRTGPLDGVALAWKDNVDSAGIATEAGTRLLAGRVPERDATVLARATAAGLVCLGKTHLSELAFSGLGVNPMTATSPNAHDPALAPGGSSSGSAVAVALGLASAGIGTDTGGSVRIPAAWNGLVGLKTTHGLVPNDGVVALAESLDTVGPLARSVEDAALCLEALTGRPVAEAAPATRLLVAGSIVAEGCDPEVSAAFAAARERLGRGGVALAEGPVPEFAEALDICARLSAIVTYEGWRHWGAEIEAHPGAMYPMIEKRFRAGAAVEADADRLARAALAALRERIVARMAEHGPILAPTVACLPPPVDRLLAEEDHYTERNLLALRNTRLANLLGLSAITLPVPGHPMTGLMLIAPPFAEDRLLATAARLETLLAA